MSNPSFAQCSDYFRTNIGSAKNIQEKCWQFYEFVYASCQNGHQSSNSLPTNLELQSSFYSKVKLYIFQYLICICVFVYA